MLRLLAPLFGFAIFGALFAGLYYQPEEIERDIGPPKFRLAPADAKPDFIEPAAYGENVTVNITVLTGGPIDVLIVDMENSTFRVLNGTSYGFGFEEAEEFIDIEHSRLNVTQHYNFTFVADGENRIAIFLVSRLPMPENWENMTAEEREPHITEVFVNMRYLESEKKSLIFGYIMAVPSGILIGYTLWAKARRRPEEGGEIPPAYEYPRDRGL